MAKLLGTVKANTNHAKIISQVAARSMAAPNYTTLAAPPELKRFNSQAPATKRLPHPPAELEASLAHLKRLLPLAWFHNPLTTLKLIYNLLDIMGG